MHVAVMTAHDEIFGEACPCASIGCVCLRDVMAAFLHRREVDDLVGHPAVLDLAIGLSMKPYLLTRANVASELIRPMFGPSGVSIGQMRP